VIKLAESLKITYILLLLSIYEYTGLLRMIVGVLTSCHTQYTWDRSMCFFI